MNPNTWWKNLKPRWMHPVVIQEQAVPLALHHIQLLRLPILVDIETPTRFHAGQHAHRSAGNPVFSRDRTGHILFARLARCQIPYRPLQLPGFRQRRFLQPRCDLFGVRTEFLVQHLIRPQVLLHSRNVRDPSQVPAEYQPVKPGNNPADLISELCDKLFHGVLLSFGFLSLNNKHPTIPGTPSLFGCGYAAL